MVDEIRSCYRFRSLDDDIVILIEGEMDWVESWREKIGLSGIGLLERLSIGSDGDPIMSSSSSSGRASKPLPGPTPNPESVLTVRRIIGELNIDEEMTKLGIYKEESPSVGDLRAILDEYDEAPKPPQGSPSTEPVAEGWLREALRIAVRRFGVMALPVDVIVQTIHGRHDLDDELVEGWLETQYQLGKLVKIYGGTREGFGPAPTWLDAV
uniref:Uncharacterized protein n=3 Tax=environmental samples TaxID=68359 RepID=A0A075FWX8_9EURY|nr:hypothetical protein [uncultured marine group II/III euryarchaeote AD1000_77_D05]AIF14945.1 hypothetical protein [uncultured marine group II/III euryarchaeote KM3_68_H12]AIF18480.1 hypothetical protein [uncultured marine group II/III euryarchaeote KM3_83_B05]MBC8518466.1 hypothetical protein [Euryarchaeota archaeon]